MHTKFYANKDISFELKKAETLGIIGINGAGKSTLLKQIARVIEPTSGEIITNGRVTALLELGTGFNPEINGIDNIYFNAMLLGLSKEEISRQLDDIVEFSELGDFIYEPLKTYSSGMVMRLAFSIAIHSNPQILIVDEALSVGDAHFSAKCTRALKQLKEQQLSIIYVSHDLNSLKILCDRLMLLNKGEVVAISTPETIINKYNFLIAQLNKQDNLEVKHEDCSYGKFSAEITDVQIYATHTKSNIISASQLTTIQIKIKANEDIQNKTVGILIRDKFAQDIFGTNSYYYNQFVTLKKGQECIVEFEMKMNIGVGKYTLTVAIHSDQDHSTECLHWIDNAAQFEVAGIEGEFFIGIARLEPTVRVR
ncbi:MAG: ABC transporter ATP-binding protein [Epsilonproteobacteria bacterium]|nr:ABC transporter ATP-binding protein [Campylobacterota bacterium]